MGTTLTGTTPQDTYDSLIKVTDNGPLSGSLKVLSDGLGNDSTLSLSTAAASIAGTLAVTGVSTFNGLPTVNLAADNTTVGIFHTGGGSATKGLKISTFAAVNDNAGVTLDAQTSTGVLAFATVGVEKMRITSAGNVGIGTSAPAVKLDIVGASGNTQLNITSVSGTFPFITLDQTGVVKYAIQNTATTGLFTITEAGVGNRLVIAKTSGNVGIGTDVPTTKLQISSTSAGAATIAAYLVNESVTVNTEVRLAFAANTNTDASTNRYSYISALNTSGSNGQDLVFATNTTGNAATEKLRILAAGGLTFNGDTAAANALDDYEEGTWTMGVSFGGASVGVTALYNTGSYTKIGRQVTVNGALFLTSKGSSTGDASITGLPFTVGSNSEKYASASLYLSAVTFANQFQAYVAPSTTKIDLRELTELGVESGLTNSDFANNSALLVNLTYFV